MLELADTLPPPPDDLAGILSSDVPAVRMRALGVLQRIPGDEALRLIAQALRDPDVDVLFTAAHILADIRTPQAVEALFAVAVDPRMAIVRRVVAAEALGRVRGLPEHVVAGLRLLAETSDLWLKRAAREALMMRARW